MPFSLRLPRSLERQGWKVKIRDRERLEPPHVSIIRGTRVWRVDLRTGKFMDIEPDAADVAGEVKAEVYGAWVMLQQRWDAIYPGNPVQSKENDNE